MDDSSSVQYPASEASSEDRLDSTTNTFYTQSASFHASASSQEDAKSRQKRKRTSPEDQAILEAAYKHDPKPDKAARSKIVTRVSLSEKEVQIWFQNRRQSSRRKSRPLLPHEVAQYQMARSAVNDPLTTVTPPSSVSETNATSTLSEVLVEAQAKEGPDQDVVPSVVSLASIPSMQPTSTDPKPRVQRSKVRLSMSFNGNASVDVNSPSPKRPKQIPIVATLVNKTRIQRSMSGRSRDSRAWEFWCDKDTRSELEEKAEKDANGSAADAIDLLRSSSGRSILGPISVKRNSMLSRRPSEVKRSRINGKPRTLHRSSTSHGRLQGGQDEPKKSTLKHADSEFSIYIPGNESDKENWSPGEAATKGEEHGKRNPATDPEADMEIAAFMGEGRQNRSLSSDDDLNCVQGLLSLSRGGR